MKPRIVVFAYSDVGHACLKFLLKRGENVVGVYTHEDRPGEKIWFPSVQDLANEHSVAVRTAENLKAEKEFNFLQNLSPDLIFSFYYRNLIPSPVLQLPPLGSYNIHGSFLPQYRGRAPINWAVLNGETKTGATLHVMTEKADAGDIVDQERVPIGPDDTAAQVQTRVTQAAVQVLARQIENLKSGKAPRIPQDSLQSSIFGRRSPEDGAIDWTWPARRIHNLVRAVSHPYPGAFGLLLGEKTWIWQARPSSIAVSGRPGTITVKQGNLLVGCGQGALEILCLQKENQQEMTGQEFSQRYLIQEKKS